jgi:hypothetical protein
MEEYGAYSMGIYKQGFFLKILNSQICPLARILSINYSLWLGGL